MGIKHGLVRHVGTQDVNIIAGDSVDVLPTHNATAVSGLVVEVGSSNAIVITSGAHTIYIQDLIVSVETAMNVKFFSAANTTLGPLFFATEGGTRFVFLQPMVLNSNESLTVTPSSSGTCSVYAAGYTVT